MLKVNRPTWIILVICLIIYAAFRFYAFYKQDEITSQINTGFNRNNDHLIFTKHARCRMDCRHITENEIKEILYEGNINYNKSDLNNSRGPKYALEGYSHEHQHLRIIFAPENNAMVVVTCIDLDTEFQCSACN